MCLEINPLKYPFKSKATDEDNPTNKYVKLKISR